MKNDRSKWYVRALLQCAAMFLLSGATNVLWASCMTEVDKIVKSSKGRVTAPDGNAVAGAEVTITSASGVAVSHTKSDQTGSFHLTVDPGKYRVEVEAEGFLRLYYVVDLRSKTVDEPFAVPLQKSSQCHDMRIITGEDVAEDKCSSEVILPNLVLPIETVLSGEVRDESGAPLANSVLVLRKISASLLQPTRLDTKTDNEGRFTLDESEAGEYRLLASPHRGFAQPKKLDCYEQQDCRLEITLKANPSDLPYAGCPVQ